MGLVADIWACFEGANYGDFLDIDKITMFADYRVPQILNHFGVISYSPRLQSLLKTNQLIEPFSAMEIEIRGCSIWSVELVKRKMMQLAEQEKNQPTQLNAIVIDFYLWDKAKDIGKNMNHIPIHKTITKFY